LYTITVGSGGCDIFFIHYNIIIFFTKIINRIFIFIVITQFLLYETLNKYE
jgi:hypothetical protein